MSFSTEILKPNIDKYALVRLRPKLKISSPTSLGSNQYLYVLDEALNCDEVLVNGVGNGFVQSGTSLTVTSTTDLMVSTNIVVLCHFIYFTGEKTRYTDGSNGIDEAEWLPALRRYPTFSQTMRNISDGVFSLSASTIDLDTTDLSIQELLIGDNSFASADVKVWSCIGSEANNRVIFDGKITSVTISNGVASFTVIDSFLKMLNTATYETYNSAYVTPNGSNTTYPDISTPDEPAKFTIGYSSPFKAKALTAPVVFGAPSSEAYYVTGGQRLIKNTPKTINQTSECAFYVGRFIGTALKKMTFGTVTRCYKEVVDGPLVGGDQTYTTYYYVQCTNFSGEIGDLLPNGLPGVEADRCFICNNQPVVGPDAQTYQFICFVQEWLFASPTSPASGLQSNPTMVDNSYDSFCVYRAGINEIRFPDGTATTKDTFYYIQRINSTITPRITSHGTVNGQPISSLYIDIDYDGTPSTLMDLFRFSDLDPANFYCRFSPATEMSHGDTMKFIVKSAGLTTNDASFTQADVDLDASVSLTFPLNNENRFKRYLDDAQYLAKSTLGVLRVNSDREVEYEIVSNPTAAVSDGTRDDSNILMGSFTASVDYQDVISEVKFRNPQLEDIRNIAGAGPGYVVTNTTAQYLHEATKSVIYEHCLYDMANRRLAISGYLAEPTVEYIVTTASEDLNTAIGDVLTLNNPSVLDTDSELKAVVIEVNNSMENSTIKLNELRGVP